jgi:Major Facilitator Superfamily
LRNSRRICMIGRVVDGASGGASGENDGGLLRRRDFRHLWAADLISQLGTRMSFLAVPLLAVATLHASAFEVSLLRASQTVAYLLIGLQVGAWCDRMRCRPVLVVADLGRAVALGSVPLAAALGVLGLGQLYVVVFVVGVLTVFFDVAHQTYLPRLVERSRLIEGNARLQGNSSVAAVAAPVPAGYLVQWFTGAGAVLVDAASYLWSALWLRSIRRPRPPPFWLPAASLHHGNTREQAPGTEDARDTAPLQGRLRPRFRRGGAMGSPHRRGNPRVAAWRGPALRGPTPFVCPDSPPGASP